MMTPHARWMIASKETVQESGEHIDLAAACPFAPLRYGASPMLDRLFSCQSSK